MKKITATILSAALCSALFASGTALSCAQNFSALAEETQTPTASAQLIAPTSYEQYLSLTKPSSVAVAENYVAIADGKTLHLYDRTENVYHEYEHGAEIQKIDFDNAGNLYFLSRARLYRLPLQSLRDNTPQPNDTGIVCNGFAVSQDMLCYYIAGDNLVTFRSLSSDTETEVSLTNNLQSESPIAFGKNDLYCVCENGQNGYTVYAINPQTQELTPLTQTQEKLKSLALVNNLLCLITQSGNFYSYNVTDLSASERTDELTPITMEKGGYISLCALGNDAYVIRNNVVRHYSASEAEFTDYEIGASSSSTHRFNGATEVILSENRLFIADDENDRISVYNTETESFETAIDSTLPTPYLASYGNTLIVASQTETIVYSLAKRTYGEELLTLENEDVKGEIIGVASVYGRYYVLTDNNYCYMLSKESGDWEWSETHKNTETLRAVAFTADVYGSLYIAYDDDTAHRFTEKELLNAEAEGVKILDGLRSPEKISVDYETNLYALNNGILTQYTQNDEGMYALNTSYTPSYGLVKDENPCVKSFAFGVEDAYTYLLYEGDYIVKTDELQIPEVNPIPIGNATELILGDGSAEFSAVTVATDSILIEFDVSLLESASEFPYVAFERTQREQTALKIGEEGDYSILVVQKERTGNYATCLVLTSSCTPLERAEYRTDYAEAQTGHLTNAVSVYKFPYLNELLTVSALSRGEQVTLVGEVIKLDHAYYEIRFSSENGNEKTGYIPKAYVTLFDGSTPVPETEIFGETETDTDAVWRCAYLILGFTAITILVDLLILHKPKNTEE